MPLNLATIHGFVVKEIGSKRSLRESMDRIIAKCAKGYPRGDWDKLAALPYDDLLPFYPNNSLIGWPVVKVREMPLASCGLLMGMPRAW